jgi:glycosyltransferase involved in cell wall biosynthesis
MHILTATCYPNYGGSTKILLASSEALRQRHVVTVRAPFEAATSRSSLAMSLTPLASIAQKLASLPRLARIVAAELRYVRALGPDLIYVHDGPSLYVYGIIARALGVPLVWHVHGEEGSGLSKRMKDWCCDAKIYVAGFSRPAQSRVPAFLVRNLVEAPDLPLAVRTHKRRLCMVASICDRKNQLVGVDIVKELMRRGHDASLHLFGRVLEEDYLAKVKQSVANAGLQSRVIFEGHQPPEEIYRNADIVMLPSKYEALPLAFLEALACGVPVVASDIPAHREIADVVGIAPEFLPVALTPEAFADAVERIDSALALEYSVRVRNAFSKKRFGDDLNSAFDAIEARLSNRASPVRH